MKLIAIILVSNGKIIKSHYGELPFWYRSSISETINEASIKLSSQGKNMTVEISDYICHVYSGSITMVAVTDNEYPPGVIYQLSKIINTDTNIEKLFNEYQDPTNIDKVLKIQKEISDITDIMRVNLDTIISRGESLQDMLIKSENLSFQSKVFLTETKKLNSCCCIL